MPSEFGPSEVKAVVVHVVPKGPRLRPAGHGSVGTGMLGITHEGPGQPRAEGAEREFY